MNEEELELSIYRFQNDDECKILLCDETGGEGRNLQGADFVIHIDLPWDANAIEQRIGRLDRLGRPADKDVCSVVTYAKETLEEELHLKRTSIGEESFILGIYIPMSNCYWKMGFL